MPMTVRQKAEKVQRFKVAYTRAKDALELQPRFQECHPGSDIANKWGIITAAYSGLEQNIKYLIAEESSLTVEELINQREHTSSGEGNFLFRTHNLSALFSHLENNTKSLARDYYSQYQSLHSYIEINNLDDFLSEVSGPRGKGYERWRYTLIDDEEQLPRNSANAMVEIWGVFVEIALSRLDECSRVEMLEEKLVRELDEGFQDSITEIERAVFEEQFSPDLENEAEVRLFRDEHKLDVFAKILQHFASFKSHGIHDLSDELSKVVDYWLKNSACFGLTGGMSSLRWFIERASGRTPYSESIRWDADSNRFVDIAWSLDVVCNETLPQGAITIRKTNPSRSLQKLKNCANECGYKVRENRSYTNPLISNKTDYFRTLEICESVTTNSVLTIWQRPARSHEFSFVVEQHENEILPPVRNWISLLRRRLK